jgi:hypothetical protein
LEKSNSVNYNIIKHALSIEFGIFFAFYPKTKTLPLLLVLCATATDELGARASRQEDGIANAILFQSDGNGYARKVHADERAANIKPCLRANLLNGYGSAEICPRGGGKGAACLGLRNNAHLFKSIGFCTLALNDECTVKVLAALCREVDALLL